jgi:hypothetical protein
MNKLPNGVNYIRKRKTQRSTFSSVREVSSEKSLPTINIHNRRLRVLTEEAVEALQLINYPTKIFVRSGNLVRIRDDESSRLSIEIITENILRFHLERAANFVGGRGNPTKPPRYLVQDILSSGSWDFPVLLGIVETPILRPDGSIFIQPGYDPESKLFFKPDPSLDLLNINDHPSQKEINTSLDRINELFHDFPFEDEASKANAIALLITSVVRPAINGAIPMALVDAPQSGTAKTLLCQIISLVAKGHPATLTTTPNHREEWRKMITSALMDGSPIIILDNVHSRLDSPDLASVLTSGEWSDRLLGRNEIVHLPHRSIWVGNGNNIILGGDLPRRCYWIRMDARSSHPWERTDFLHPYLENWAMSNRALLLWSIMTLTKAWFSTGRQKFSGYQFGGFSEWAETVGGILGNSGITSFLDNQEPLQRTSDDDGGEWEVFFARLHTLFCGREVMATSVCQALEDDPSLINYLPTELCQGNDKTGNYLNVTAQKLGKALSAKCGTRFGETEVRVERAYIDSHDKIHRWRFVRGDCGVCGKIQAQKAY